MTAKTILTLFNFHHYKSIKSVLTINRLLYKWYVR